MLAESTVAHGLHRRIARHRVWETRVARHPFHREGRMADRSVCWRKGRARYLTVAVDDRADVNAAWYYPKPWPLARRIAGHVAFWAGVEITG
ncbi:MAG TPA: DUF427 domain-containing protein [Egibacteraceae bacterium]|nr:DUF427 domain-containing protein [Egibacteraceae bacterium]